MPNKILTDEGWEQRIRDKLGVDIAYLPDSVIQQPDYITIAESNIIRTCPEYASLADADKIHIEAAVVCECAKLLCPSMKARLPKSESGPAYKVEINIDWDKAALDLGVERDANLGNIESIDIFGTFYGFDLSGRV